MSEVVWLDDVPEDERWRITRGRPHHFRVGETEYITTLGSTPGESDLFIKKPPGLVERTVDLLRGYKDANIVELGISCGGSTALIAQTAEPKKLVALELSDEPVQQLERFLDDTSRRSTVHPYYGVDQADRATVSRILDDEFGTEPLDLVTDDASHLLDLTRSSFEMLFPRLRPGGTYIIEDWNWEHVRANAVAETLATEEDSPGREAFNAELKARLADRSSAEYAAFEAWYEAQAADPQTPVVKMPERPLSILALELLVARAWSGDVVSELIVQEFWVIVRRGPAELDPDTFRVADIVHDRFGLIP
jgi:hypothetical protein